MTKALKTSKATKASKKSLKAEVVTMTASQKNFVKSLMNIREKRSTGSELLDKLGDKVLTGIFEGKVKFNESNDWNSSGSGFEGTLGKAEITVFKQPKGKVTRTVLNVAGTEIFGEYAARAYKMAHASVNKKGRKTIEVNEAEVNNVMGLLD